MPTTAPDGSMNVTNVGHGLTATASFTPVAEAYGAGDVISVAQEFVFRDKDNLLVPSGSLIRILSTELKIDITATPAGATNYLLPLYNVTPLSAQANNDLWTMVTGDLSSYKGKINLGTCVDEGSCLYVKTNYVDTDIKLLGTSLFGEFVTVAAHTATAVARSVTIFAVVL